MAALLVESERTAGSLRSRFPSDIGRLATGDIVIGTYLEMLQSSDTEAKVNAEVALLQGIGPAKKKMLAVLPRPIA